MAKRSLCEWAVVKFPVPVTSSDTWTRDLDLKRSGEAGQDRRNDHKEFRNTYFDMAIIYIYNSLYILYYIYIYLRFADVR